MNMPAGAWCEPVFSTTQASTPGKKPTKRCKMTTRKMTKFVLTACWLVVLPFVWNQTSADEAPVAITSGKQVGIEFTLKLEDGSVFASNAGGEPLVFTQGGGDFLPALEEAVAGLHVGDTKTVKLEAGQAYGAVDAEAFQSVPKEQIPEHLQKPGTILVAQSQDGQKHQVRVHEVNADHVVVDHNHPLAGKDVTFDIKILSIQ
jgi:FKBP-type peptidyl-prolyl cis-trans isomerase 2